MKYTNKILNLLKQIKDEQKLKYIYIIVKDIVDENK